MSMSHFDNAIHAFHIVPVGIQAISVLVIALYTVAVHNFLSLHGPQSQA